MLSELLKTIATHKKMKPATGVDKFLKSLDKHLGFVFTKEKEGKRRKKKEKEGKRRKKEGKGRKRIKMLTFFFFFFLQG